MSPSDRPILFNYLDPADYLRAVLQARKSHNRRFSLRMWARELGLREPTPLTLILGGKRSVPLHYLPKLETSLSLTALEKRYLEARILERGATDFEEKSRWQRKAEKIAHRFHFKPKQVPQFKTFENPLVMLLLVLTDLPGFKFDLQWIQNRIAGIATIEEISAIYKNLILKGHLSHAPETGKLVRTEKHLWSTQDVSSNSIQTFHELSLKSSISALKKYDVEEREFGSFLFTARSSDLPLMKKRIRDFTSGFIADFSEKSEEDTIFHLNLNLFPRTKKDSKA